MQRSCLSTQRNGGHQCYKGLFVHEKLLMANYGCPRFFSDSEPIVESKAFCWCGLESSFTYRSLATPKHWRKALPPKPVDGEADGEERFLRDEGKLWNETSGDGSDDDDGKVVEEDMHGVEVEGGACHNRDDGKKLKHLGKYRVRAITKACAQSCNEAAVDSGKDACTIHEASNCFESKTWVKPFCASCFGQQIHCSQQHCLEECACAPIAGPLSKACEHCNRVHCDAQFRYCSGIDPDGSRSKSTKHVAESPSVLPLSTNGGKHLLLV